MITFDGTQCQHYMTEDAYWDAIDESSDEAIAQAEEASEQLLHHGCRAYGQMVVVGRECSPACEFYAYNGNLGHQCAGLLLESVFYQQGKRPYDPIDGLYPIFCGECGIYFAIQGAHLDSGEDVHCVACGARREVEGVPEDLDDLPRIDDIAEFLELRDMIEAIISA